MLCRVTSEETSCCNAAYDPKQSAHTFTLHDVGGAVKVCSGVSGASCAVVLSKLHLVRSHGTADTTMCACVVVMSWGALDCGSQTQLTLDYKRMQYVYMGRRGQRSSFCQNPWIQNWKKFSPLVSHCWKDTAEGCLVTRFPPQRKQDVRPTSGW